MSASGSAPGAETRVGLPGQIKARFEVEVHERTVGKLPRHLRMMHLQPIHAVVIRLLHMDETDALNLAPLLPPLLKIQVGIRFEAIQRGVSSRVRNDAPEDVANVTITLAALTQGRRVRARDEGEHNRERTAGPWSGVQAFRLSACGR